MAEMERMSKGKGLAELHRLWMTYLSQRTQAEQDRWNKCVSGGTVVEGNFSWLRIGAIYVEHQGRLVQLSDTERDRARSCMTKH
jgi:hypothetical protein